MKNKLRSALVLTLALLMMLTVAACGSSETTEATPAPSADPTEDPVFQEDFVPTPDPEPTIAPLVPEDTPVPTADAQGLMTYTSMGKGFTFQYSQDYITQSNETDNGVVYAGGDLGIPYCMVALYTGTDAQSYLSELIAGVQIEEEETLVNAPQDPVAIEGDRQLYTISYSYTDEDAGGTVACVYYAEDLPSGDVAVYNSVAMEGETQAVDEILALAMETFQQQ